VARRRALLAVAALAALPPAAAAGDDDNHPAARTPAGLPATADAEAVVVRDGGAVVAAWVDHTVAPPVVRIAVRRAGAQRFGRVRALGPISETERPALSMRGGRFAAAWSGRDHVVRARAGVIGGPLGPRLRAGRTRDYPTVGVRVGRRGGVAVVFSAREGQGDQATRFTRLGERRTFPLTRPGEGCSLRETRPIVEGEAVLLCRLEGNTWRVRRSIAPLPPGFG
jgi:hypothetical protein